MARDVLSLTDLLLLVLGAAALGAPVAHLVIAYLYAPRQISRWLESPKGLEAALGHALPLLGEQLGEWTKTEQGQAFVEHLVSAIVDRGRREAEKMMGRASGHASQTARNPLMAILGGIKLGSPMLDGAWAMVAPMVLPKIAPILLRTLPGLVQAGEAAEEGQA